MSKKLESTAIYPYLTLPFTNENGLPITGIVALPSENHDYVISLVEGFPAPQEPDVESPSISSGKGHFEFVENGELHRDHGPAVIDIPSGQNEYWTKGRLMAILPSHVMSYTEKHQIQQGIQAQNKFKDISKLIVDRVIEQCKKAKGYEMNGQNSLWDNYCYYREIGGTGIDDAISDAFTQVCSKVLQDLPIEVRYWLWIQIDEGSDLLEEVHYRLKKGEEYSYNHISSDDFNLYDLVKYVEELLSQPVSDYWRDIEEKIYGMEEDDEQEEDEDDYDDSFEDDDDGFEF